MKQNCIGEKHDRLWMTALIAGLSGGLAEIVWVGLYSHWSGLDGSAVARQITASVSLTTEHPASPLLGVLIHMMLSLAVAAAYALVVWRPLVSHLDLMRSIATAVLVLVAIWAANFFLLLPILHPGFISLMPYPVTLVSKILFGISMGSAFGYAGSPRHAVVVPC